MESASLYSNRSRIVYPKKLAKWLSVIQIILALVISVMFILAVLVYYILGKLSLVVGILCFTSGVVNLYSATKSSSRNVLIAVCVAAALSTLAAVVYVTFAVFGTGNVCGGNGLCRDLMEVQKFLCVAEGIISIIFLALACRSICQCETIVIVSDKSTTSDSDVATRPSCPAPPDEVEHLLDSHVQVRFLNEGAGPFAASPVLSPPAYKDVMYSKPSR